MLANLLQGSTVPVLKQVAKFNEQRQQALASNIANIDTPGYKTRDLPQTAFRQALQAAVQQLQSLPSTSPSVSAAYPQARSSSSIDDLFKPHLFQSQTGPAPNITFNDAGDRSYEHQVTEMQKTLLMQNYALKLMQTQFGMLEAVITERV